jgi:hypothetical protein
MMMMMMIRQQWQSVHTTDNLRFSPATAAAYEATGTIPAQLLHWTY